MKLIISFVLILFPIIANAKVGQDLIVRKLMKKKMYYSAGLYLIDELRNKRIAQDDRVLKNLETISHKVGLEIYTPMLRGKDIINAPSFYYAKGLFYFQNKSLNLALEMLAKVPSKHGLAAEASIVSAQIHDQKDDSGKALMLLDECHKLAQEQKGQHKTEKVKRFYQLLSDKCRVHKARIFYNDRRLEEARAIYEAIDKRSYIWPHLLIENAWTNYHMGDYNRTLGLAITYKSPLLVDYFYPEAEALMALSYFRLCLWEDSNIVIENFYKHYKKKAANITQIINQTKKKENGFYELVTLSKSELAAIDPFLQKLIIQIRKKIKFNLDLHYLKNLKKEQERIKRFKKWPLPKIPAQLEELRNNYIAELNFLTQAYMVSFINKINSISFELFNIKLEIISRKKDLLYEKQKLISDRSRGNLDNVNRRADQYFWQFHGEFWADELGDYSFGLQSNCEKTKE